MQHDLARHASSASHRGMPTCMEASSRASHSQTVTESPKRGRDASSSSTDRGGDTLMLADTNMRDDLINRESKALQEGDTAELERLVAVFLARGK